MMIKRPQSPSSIPAPIQRDGSSSSIARPSLRSPRKLPQAVVPVAQKKKTGANETRIPTPIFAKALEMGEEMRQGATETDSQCSGVIYITENLIRKMSKEDNFHRIFKLGFTFANDLKKKIKYIESLDALKNLQVLSIAHHAIEKMEKLEKLTNLQILDLSDNSLKRIEGIESLNQLAVLNVEDNLVESIPAFVGKKLKSLRTFKIARNQLVSLHELYRLRGLPDLVEITTEGNPMCALSQERKVTVFLLRSLEMLNGVQINDRDRSEADERFQQVEVCRLEAELEKMEKKFQDSQDALGKSEAFSHVLHQNDGNLKKSNKKLKLDVENLQKKLEAKNLLLESKTKELSKACEKQFKLEQELAFYKLDTKFDEFWKFSGYENEEDEDQYIDEDQSAYIGKARFKPNSVAKEKILPSKAQMINLIKLVKRKDDTAEGISRTIIGDLEEALNFDLTEKQASIAQAEEKLGKLKSKLEKVEKMEAYEIPRDSTDAPQGLVGIEKREKMRQALANLIQEAKEMQATIAELNYKLEEGEKALQEREDELKHLKDQLSSSEENSPYHRKVMETVAAKEEQCHQLEEYMEQLASLLSETENELTEKAEAVRALEMKLKVGEPTVQSEMKQGLEDVVKKLTSHCEGLKAQIRDQKKLNDDVAKERDFLKGKAEQLEADVDRFYNDKDELDGIRNRLVDKEKALRDEMEINDKLREAYEKLMQRLNKKKRHVGIGSHDVWRDDPQVENLKGRLNDSEDEIRKLRNELERVKGQREAERGALEQRLEEGQSKLDEAVQAARDAGDSTREAEELDKQLRRLQAERAAMRRRLDELEEDLSKEKDESIPWKSLSRECKRLLLDLDSGDLRSQMPIETWTKRDKQLHQEFDDLRKKLNGNRLKNEEELEAKGRKLEKLEAKVEQLHDDFGRAQLELSKTRQRAREVEQELQDSNQQLGLTKSRLKNALNERSNNEKLVQDELDALQERLDEFQRTAGQAKREANELRSKLEDADRKMRAVEQLAKEAEADFETAKEEAEELRKQLKKSSNDKIVQAKSGRNAVENLEELLQNQKAAMQQATFENDRLHEKLKAAEKRLVQAENRGKQLEQQLALAQSTVQDLQSELNSLKKQQKKDKIAQKEKLVSAREKFEQLQKGLEAEINRLRNQANDDDKYIASLKEQLKKSRGEFSEELDALANEIVELQAEVLEKGGLFQQAEKNNNRLLENLAKIEDENNSLNDRLNFVEKRATDAIEKERLRHAEELKELEQEIDQLKRLISELKLEYENEAYQHEREAVTSLSCEIEKLHQKVAAAEEDALGREQHHFKFKQRLSDEINKLQQTVENRGHEERHLREKNRNLQENLQNDINNLLSQIASLRRSLGYRESELASLRDSAQPLVAHFKSRIGELVDQLGRKEAELSLLRAKLGEVSREQQQTMTVIKTDPRFGDLSSQVEAIKHSLADLQSNVSYLLTSMPREGGNSQPSYTPLRPSVLEVTKGQTYIPQQRTPVGQNSMSTVHHYHYGAANDLFVEDIVSGNANVDKGSIYVHHHNEKEAEKKRKKGCKKNVSYDDDYEFCNIPEHDNVDNHVSALESRLRNSTLSRSKLSDDSPLKLELRQLKSKVEEAVTRRQKKKELKRAMNNTSSF